MCRWNRGTSENAAASQGFPQGQGSSGSRRTRMSRVSNLVPLKGKTGIGLLYRDRLAKGLGFWIRSEKPSGYEGLGSLLRLCS